MSTKKLSNQSLGTIIFGCVTLILGLMFCCFGAKVLSYIIGGAIILFGVLFVVNSIIRTKALLTMNGLVGVILGAFGSMVIVRNLASLLLDFIPWIMISVGALIIADSFLRFFARKDVSLAIFIIELVVGTLVTAAGFCVKFIDDFANFASIVFGIVLVIYSLFIIFTTIIKKN